MSQRKVALVTDGMTWLGTAICRRLQRAGMIVVASYPAHQRDPEAWLAAQRDEGGTFSAWRADAAAFDDCAALVGKVLAAYGRLDVLVNLDAGPGGDGGDAAGASLGQMSPSQWRAGLRPAHDAFNMNKHALPPMLERQWGRIIQVARGPAWPLPRQALAASYAAANAALHGLTRALALETARHGVTVNTVMPGLIRRHDEAMGGVPQPGRHAGTAADAAAAAHIPVGRAGEATEVAALVGYLASESAAFVTGAQIAINGGQHMF